MAKPRIKITPSSPKQGDVVEIKTLIEHKMESGFRKDKKTGAPIPRKIINKFEALLDSKPVFWVEINPAVSANPYLKFFLKAEKSGELEFKWSDDDGNVTVKKQTLTVSEG